ncbi:hypothetical protein ACWEKR_21295 [Nocardia sp. NPDC004573]
MELLPDPEIVFPGSVPTASTERFIGSLIGKWHKVSRRSEGMREAA